MERDLLGRLFGKKPEQPVKLLGSPDSPMVETYKTADFLDEKRRDQEIKDCAQQLKIAQDRLSLCDMRIFVRTKEDLKNYNNLQQDHKKTWDVLYFLTASTEQYQDVISQAQSPNGRPVTLRDFQTYHFLQAGGEFLIHDLVNRQMKHAQKLGLADRAEPYARLLEFYLTQNTHLIRINGISLQDFVSENPTLKLSAPAAFQFIVESELVRHKRSHEAIWKLNQDPFQRAYPNLTKHAIESATARVRALANSQPQTTDPSVIKKQALVEEIVRYALRFQRAIYESRQDFYQTLLDPGSREFVAVKTVMEPYLKRGRSERASALSIAGLNETIHIYELYRQSIVYAQNGPESQFYALLRDSVDKYVEEVPSCEQVITIDDLDAIFDEESPASLVDVAPPTVDSLGRIVASIFEKSSNKDYDIKLQEIAWDRFASPQDARIEFDKNRPQKFSITLFYVGREGEYQEVSFTFDTKKGFFDWNIINDPSDPKLVGFRRSALLVTQSILLRVQAQAEKQYQNKLLQRKGVVQEAVAVEKKPKERFRDESYEVRKQTRVERQTQTSVEKQIVVPDIGGAEGEVKKTVVIPAQEILEDMLRSLSTVDRKIVLQGINRFNCDGVGWFKKEKGIGKAGVSLYGLRVNCTAPKGVRVLLTLSQSSAGEMKFEISDIDYRRNIFRNAGI